MNENSDSSLLCFLTGLASGAALALLLAPRSGVETRGFIGRKVKDGQDWMMDTAATAKEDVMARASGLRDGVKEAAAVMAR